MGRANHGAAPERSRFDPAAAECLDIAKVIARGEASEQVDSAHVFRAALLLAPEELRFVYELALIPKAAVEADRTRLKSVAKEKRVREQMPVTPELGGVLFRGPLASTALVKLPILVREILARPSTALRELLEAWGGRSGTKNPAWSGGYGDRREYLRDLHRLWEARREVWRLLHFGSVLEKERSERQQRLQQDIASLEKQIEIRRANTDRAEVEALDGAPDEGPAYLYRQIRNGLIFGELYGLGDSLCGHITLRDIAEMISIDSYPANCARVLVAAERLRRDGVVESDAGSEDLALSSRLRLNASVLRDVIDALEKGRPSNEDFQAIVERL